MLNHKRKLIVANWKMNLSTSEASVLVHRIHERTRILRDVEMVIAPSHLHLQPLSMQIDRRKFRLAAQNAYQIDNGAFTGEVSFSMLREIVHYVIIGHSERRHIFNETLQMISEKMAACVRNELKPILCIGETATEKAAGETKLVIHDQLTTALSHLTAQDLDGLVIAYEPVWAISNGQNFGSNKTPTPGEVSEVVDYIKSVLTKAYNKKVADSIRILYGGSTNKDNAYGYLDIVGIDGLLIGGASLHYEQFASIVQSAHKITIQELTK